MKKLRLDNLYVDKTHEDSGEEPRLNFCTGFCGANRTGKTSTARRLANAWRENNSGIIMAHDPQEQFGNDLVDIKLYADDKEWIKKVNRLRNGLLILDELRLIHPTAYPIDGLLALLSNRAHYNIDIIYIVHNPALILNVLTYYTTHYYIFYTLSKQGSFKDKIPNYSLCINASHLVNDYVNKYGRGEYPDFPYVIVDTENQKLRAISMDEINQ